MIDVSREADWEKEEGDILRCLRDAYCPKIDSMDPKRVLAYYRNDDQSLPVSMRWVLHKYRHCIDVYEAGLRLMQENSLQEVSQSVRKDWKAALLLHDIARVDELSDSEEWLFDYPHGTVGIERLHRLGFQSAATLIPVFLHDRFDCDFDALTPESISRIAGWEKMPEATQTLVLGLLERFRAMDDAGKDAIRLGSWLLVDADQLGNLLHFESMLALSESGSIPFEPKVSLKIRDALLKGGYVRWSDVQTFADRVLGFMAWMSFGHFPSFSRILLEEHVAERMTAHLLNQVVIRNPKTDIHAFRDELNEYCVLFHRRLRQKLGGEKA